MRNRVEEIYVNNKRTTSTAPATYLYVCKFQNHRLNDTRGLTKTWSNVSAKSSCFTAPHLRGLNIMCRSGQTPTRFWPLINDECEGERGREPAAISRQRTSPRVGLRFWILSKPEFLHYGGTERHDAPSMTKQLMVKERETNEHTLFFYNSTECNESCFGSSHGDLFQA